MKKIGLVVFALTLAAPLMSPNPSAAEGAIAVGSTGNVAKDGIAMGLSVDNPTREAAIANALKECHAYNAPKAAALCQIVETFTRQCWATAFDPKVGTPGAGWAVAANKEKASSQALAKCRATAGASRRSFCKVDGSNCDTKD